VSWFREPSNPAALERLRKPYFCANCGIEHAGLMDLAAFAPDPWPHIEAYEPNSALRMEGDFLSEDFCVLQGRYFMVRGVLQLPIHGVAEKFGFGCWSTLSRENFDKYVEGFDAGEYTDWGPWSGYLCNKLADYIGDKPEPVLVYPQRDRQRPTLRIVDEAHPLAVDQEHGISPERMLGILETYGHAPPAEGRMA